MLDNKKISQMTCEINQSNFFSTQVSSRSQIPKHSSRYNNYDRDFSQNFKLLPSLKYKKIKQESKQAKQELISATRSHLKALSSLSKTHKQTQDYRQKFIKLYNIKKFKIEHDQSLNDTRFSNNKFLIQSTQKMRKTRFIKSVVHEMLKHEEEDNLSKLVIKNKKEKQDFQDQMRRTNQKIFRRINESAKKIKRQKFDLMVKKNQIMELNQTKSKFNYLNKVNNEMEYIKDLESVLEEIKKVSQASKKQEQRNLGNIFSLPKNKIK